jgi:hypothetical protein
MCHTMCVTCPAHLILLDVIVQIIWLWVRTTKLCVHFLNASRNTSLQVRGAHVMDRVTVGQIFLRVRRFSPVSNIPPCLSILIWPVGWRVGLLVAAVMRHGLTPSTKITAWTTPRLPVIFRNVVYPLETGSNYIPPPLLFSNSVFCPPSLYMGSYFFRNKQRLFVRTSLSRLSL